ncbi:MAG: polyphenol oxidase family protein [Acidimicrobiia bacterium]
MIRPPGFRGAAFSTAEDGDVRADPAARRALAGLLGISPEWATVRQVHGNRVVAADRSGLLGPADGLFTSRVGLPVSVAVADCVPVILEGETGVGVVHAGWRGLVQGVIQALRQAMQAAGLRPRRAALGPSIGPCCYEVGPEVAGRFPDRLATTTWGTVSVDLWSAAEESLSGLAVWRADSCTRCQEGFFSHRRDGTPGRQVGVAWLG